MQAAPLIGLTSTVIAMKGAFAELGKSGASDVGALSGYISEALVSTVIGLAVAAAGAVLLAISVIGLRYRRTWAVVLLCFGSMNFIGVLFSIVKAILSGSPEIH